jgi:hypothetical protein
VDYLDMVDEDFESSRRPFVPANRAAETQGRFIGKPLRRREGIVARRLNDALAVSGSVPHLQKKDLAAAALAVKPSLYRDLMTFVSAESIDSYSVRHGYRY